MTLVAELVALRKLRGMTQQNIADALGVRQWTVSEFEQGITDPTLARVQRYARAVGARVVVSLVPEAERNSREFRVGDLVTIADPDLEKQDGVVIAVEPEILVEGVTLRRGEGAPVRYMVGPGMVDMLSHASPDAGVRGA